MQLQLKSASLATGVLLLGALIASAQGPGTSKHMGMYDPANETTLKGTIEAVTQQTSNQMMMGTHLTLTVDGKNQEVMLGPSSFIASQGFSFAKGDSIEVTGSKMTMMGTAYVIAREVVKDGKTLTLRDSSGKPKWAGSGMMGGRGTHEPQDPTR